MLVKGAPGHHWYRIDLIGAEAFFIVKMSSTHYDDVIMGTTASQITSLTIVYWTVFGHRSKKTSKLLVTGLCVGNSLGTGEFPAQMASNAENVSIWCRHHVASWDCHRMKWKSNYCQTSNIRCALISDMIVDHLVLLQLWPHSQTAIWDEKHLSFGNWCT